jgi:hypothetical protein
MTDLRVASINDARQDTAAGALQREIEEAIQRFVQEHGSLPMVLVLGVLRVCEHNFLSRSEHD